jgi:hypothetical protein
MLGVALDAWNPAQGDPELMERGHAETLRDHADTLRGHAETLRDHAETLRGHADTLRQRFRGTGNFVAAPASEASTPASGHGYAGTTGRLERSGVG